MNDDRSARQAANLAVAERYRAAWLAGDRAALADCYHPDFTLHYFGSNPFAGDHVGKVAALTTLAKFSQRTGRKLLEVVDVMAGPERATIIARESFERMDARPNSSACWSTPSRTTSCMNAGSKTATGRWWTRFSPTEKVQAWNCSFASRAYRPFAATSDACVPCSTILPCSMTRMRSQERTVARRCAITSVVR